MAQTKRPAPGYKDFPLHEVNLESVSRCVRVQYQGVLLAETDNALVMTETGLPAVYYFPRSDVRFELLSDNDSQTYCPFKGKARYWDLNTEKGAIKQAVWTYETPYDEVSVLADYVAFYAGKVEVNLCDRMTPAN